jgi:hypothetical protein
MRPAAAHRVPSVAVLRTFLLLLPLLLPLWAAPPASACPFCGTVGQSLAQRRDAADAVAVAEAEGTAAADASGFLAQRFRIDQVLGDTAHAAVAGETVPARVAGPIAGTAVLFGTAMAAGPQASGNGRSWSAVAADESLLGYVTAAPAITLPAAERLRWFAARLEHPDPAIAADAFTEFGLSPFTAVRAAASGLDPARLRAWVSEAGIDARRRGLYGLLLGVAAATTDDPAVARDCIDALHRAVEAPANDFRAGFDGVLAGVLVAEGQAGLDSLERRGLFGREARALDQRHLLAAVRFAGENLTETIPRERIVAATAALLTSPAVAADATVDLARYQAWETVADVSRLWDTLGPTTRSSAAPWPDISQPARSPLHDRNSSGSVGRTPACSNRPSMRQRCQRQVFRCPPRGGKFSTCPWPPSRGGKFSTCPWPPSRGGKFSIHPCGRKLNLRPRVSSLRPRVSSLRPRVST